MKMKQLILGVLSLFVLPALNGCADIEDHPDGRTDYSDCLPLIAKRMPI